MRTLEFSDLLSSYGFDDAAAALAVEQLCERSLTRRDKKGIAAQGRCGGNVGGGHRVLGP